VQKGAEHRFRDAHDRSLAGHSPILNGEERVALFISHAEPEDNPFPIWLAAKLAALGYEVWADVMRLRAGEDWQRKLQGAFRWHR